MPEMLVQTIVVASTACIAKPSGERSPAPLLLLRGALRASVEVRRRGKGPGGGLLDRLLRKLFARQVSPRLRNAAPPMPPAPLILPLGAPLTVSASLSHALDRRGDGEFGKADLRGRQRGSLD